MSILFFWVYLPHSTVSYSTSGWIAIYPHANLPAIRRTESAKRQVGLLLFGWANSLVSWLPWSWHFRGLSIGAGNSDSDSETDFRPQLC